MAIADAWYMALCIIADHSPMAYCRMANGAEFWWTLSSRSQLLADCFTDLPFLYSEIDSVTIFREVHIRGEALGCDWEVVRGELSEVVAGLPHRGGLRAGGPARVGRERRASAQRAGCLNLTPTAASSISAAIGAGRARGPD